MANIGMKGDLGKSFSSLLSHSFIRYNGVLIEKCGDQFKAGSTLYPSVEAAKKGIDSVFRSLQNSIR